MNSSKASVLAATTVVVTTLSGCGSAGGSTTNVPSREELIWGYPESADWDKVEDAVCSTGREQSPIDLTSCLLGAEAQMVAIVQGKGDSAWGQATTLANNGHDIKIKMPEPLSFKTSMRGEMYTVEQCHFHWGSEHTVNGTQQPLEAHCVHTKHGATSGRDHGVLAFFWHVGDTEDEFLAQFIDQVPAESPADGMPEEDVESSTPIEMSLLLDGLDLTHYWQYDGSLTTPPCSEVVNWQLVMSPRTLTQAQLDTIKQKIGMWETGEDRGNFRLPQPLNGRSVLGCSSTTTATPEVIWGYPESSEWNEVDDAVCSSGHEQSPIDLIACVSGSEIEMPAISQGKGDSAWGQATTLANNGHDIKIKMPEPLTFKTSMRGEMYTVEQCHFHWSSEHTVNENQQPLEAHCVHTKDGATSERDHGVLAFFWQVGETEDEFLAQFIDQVPAQSPADGEAEEDIEVSIPINMSPLLDGLDLTHYWQYDGSLTTPPCSEIVDWQLVMSPRILTQTQLDTIKEKIGSWGGADRGNFREPQPLNGRAVFGCRSTQEIISV